MQPQVRKHSILSWATKKPKQEIKSLYELSEQIDSQISTDETFFISTEEKEDCYKKIETEKVEEKVEGKVEEKRMESRVKEYKESILSKKEEDSSGSSLSFLSPPRDKFGYVLGDVNYDPSTLSIPEDVLSLMTPCERQFWEIKMEYFDTVVFFKKGKFYELFEEDAVLSSEVFGLKLSQRGSMKMTGIPEMSLDQWTDRFISKGYKVSIVDQKETSVSQNMRVKSGESKQKIIERELKEVVTESTVSSEGAGLCSLFVEETGNIEKVLVKMGVFRPMESEFCALSFEDDKELFMVKSVIKKENIKEIITERIVSFKEKVVRIRPDRWEKDASSILKEMGAEEMEPGKKNALAVLIEYLQYLKYSFTPQLVEYTEKSREYMEIDGRTVETLCLVEGGRKEKTSLMAQIDFTKTKQGKRLLRQWIIRPLGVIEEIERRYSTVEILEESRDRMRVEQCLRKVGDLNDFIKKAKNFKIRPEEIRKFVSSLKSVEEIYPLIEGIGKESGEKADRTYIPEILLRIKEASIYKRIVEGFDISGEIMPLDTDPELVAAEKYKQKVVNMLDLYGKNESRSSNISFSVKKIGREHFLECRHSPMDIPAKYIPAGSTKSTFRYTTSELKKISETYLEAEEKISFLATESITRISRRITEREGDIKNISLGISQLDCLLSFAYISGVKPVFSDSLVITGLTDARNTHIPNNLSICTSDRVVVITGPNMAGKSTFLRNVSIAIVLRQIGAKVPAVAFSGPVYDRIFTRIGANDNLIEGESTFQVEMKETADILLNATRNSFVIIDELGRGTSTKEGSAISLAVKEYLKKIECTALYATHFFSAITEEDIKMKMDYKYAQNNGKEEIVYLYKLVSGQCNDSCGIEICKMTKVPESVIRRALEIKQMRKNTLLQKTEKVV